MILEKTQRFLAEAIGEDTLTDCEYMEEQHDYQPEWWQKSGQTLQATGDVVCSKCNHRAPSSVIL